MAITAVHAVLRIPRVGGTPRDTVENTWTFGSDDGVTDINPTHILTALSDFYNVAGVGMHHAVSSYLNTSIDRTINATVEQYDITGHLDGSAAGAPISVDAFGLQPVIAGAGELPDEVAVCLSFKTPYGADVEHGVGGTRPRADDRGRIFLGPLVSHADVVDSSGVYARVHANIASDLCAAALQMQTYLNTVNESWAVWSRKRAQLTYVTSGWVDNAFDTQRRRGIEATARVGTF